MSKGSQTPSIDPGRQVLVSTKPRMNVAGYLPITTEFTDIIAIQSTPLEIEDTLRKQGIDPWDVVVIPVGLDDPPYSGPMEVTGVIPPSDLTQLGRFISDQLEATTANPGWLVIDDLIVLLMYSGDHRVVRLLRSIASRVRINDFRAMYGLERAAVSSATFRALNEICEYHVDLTAD